MRSAGRWERLISAKLATRSIDIVWHVRRSALSHGCCRPEVRPHQQGDLAEDETEPGRRGLRGFSNPARSLRVIRRGLALHEWSPRTDVKVAAPEKNIDDTEIQ